VIDSEFVAEETAVYVLYYRISLHICRASIGLVEGMRLVSLLEARSVSNDHCAQPGCGLNSVLCFE
jgi:hypothetical protein